MPPDGLISTAVEVGDEEDEGGEALWVAVGSVLVPAVPVVVVSPAVAAANKEQEIGNAPTRPARI